MGFTETDRVPPIPGQLVVCYHKCFGITVGYFIGRDTGFLFPYLPGHGVNYATHWQNHAHYTR